MDYKQVVPKVVQVVSAKARISAHVYLTPRKEKNSEKK